MWWYVKMNPGQPHILSLTLKSQIARTETLLSWHLSRDSIFFNVSWRTYRNYLHLSFEIICIGCRHYVGKNDVEVLEYDARLIKKVQCLSSGGTLMTLNVFLCHFVPEYHDMFVYIHLGKEMTFVWVQILTPCLGRSVVPIINISTSKSTGSYHS